MIKIGQTINWTLDNWGKFCLLVTVWFVGVLNYCGIVMFTWTSLWWSCGLFWFLLLYGVVFCGIRAECSAWPGHERYKAELEKALTDWKNRHENKDVK